MSINTSEITQLVQENRRWVEPLVNEVSRVVVGQKVLVHRLLIGLLSNGHVLLEGVPGLAKTLTVRTLANSIQTGFQRLQFAHQPIVLRVRDGRRVEHVVPVVVVLDLATQGLNAGGDVHAHGVRFNGAA